jgi:hypothetical protein
MQMVQQQYLNTRIILRNDSNENWTTYKDQILSKGEAGVEFVNGKAKIKIGDGATTWENLAYVGGDEAKNFQVNSLDEITDNELAVGDTAIVKTLIYQDTNNASNNKYSYTGYVYNGTGWAAMDGNYNAENVYFDEDLITTHKVGNFQTLTNGSATIAAAGKNLKQLWNAIYLKEDKSITIKKPSVSLTVSGSGTTVEVGSTFTRPTATLKITGIGSYEYGSKDADGQEYSTTTATNITFDKLKVGFGSNIDTATSYEELTAGGYTTNQTLTYTATSTDIADNHVKEGDTTYKFCAEGHHTASNRYPITNLGNYLTAGSLSGETFTATTVAESAKNDEGAVVAKGNIAASAADGIEPTAATWKITGYREGFYFGTSATEILPANITSATIRGLTTKTEKDYATGTQNVTIPVGAKTVIIACPATSTGVTDVLNTTVNANMNESFGVGKTPTKVTVGGADATSTSVGSYGKEYNVWTFTPPEAYGTAANLTITLG